MTIRKSVETPPHQKRLEGRKKRPDIFGHRKDRGGEPQEKGGAT